MKKKASAIADFRVIVQDSTFRAVLKLAIEEMIERDFNKYIESLKSKMDEELKKHLVTVTARHFEEMSAEMMRKLL